MTPNPPYPTNINLNIYPSPIQIHIPTSQIYFPVITLRYAITHAQKLHVKLTSPSPNRLSPMTLGYVKDKTPGKGHTNKRKK